MLDVKVALRKENYGEPGLMDYCKNMAVATASLSEKFGVASHKSIANAEEGSIYKSIHIQQVIVAMLYHVKEVHQHSKKMDVLLADYSGDDESVIVQIGGERIRYISGC